MGFTILPSASITNLNILNSTNANIALLGLDRAYFGDILLQDNYQLDNEILFQTITVRTMHEVTFYNLTARDNKGPILGISDVLSPKIINCNFENISSSRLLFYEMQTTIIISHNNPANSLGLDSSRATDVLIQNLTLNVIKLLFINLLLYRVLQILIKIIHHY